MEERKIELEEWVFDTLEKYGNVALPNKCKEMDEKKLVSYLQRKTGSKIKVRSASFTRFDGNGKVFDRTTYLIAEEI